MIYSHNLNHSIHKYLKVASMKRLLSVFLCLFLISGCELKKKDTNTITVWHWMTDRDQVFQELTKRYEEQIAIQMVVCPTIESK